MPEASIVRTNVIVEWDRTFFCNACMTFGNMGICLCVQDLEQAKCGAIQMHIDIDIFLSQTLV